MIIRLNGADFSKNNIGQVQFKKELSAETVNILSKYTRTLTDDQKFAFQDFLNGLKANGIWSKIGVMYMPILSSTLNECLLNLKNLTQCTTPTSNIYNVTNGWLKLTKTSGQLSTSDAVQMKLNGSNMNIHFISYIDGSASYVDGHTLITNRSVSADAISIEMTMGRTFSANYKVGATTKNSNKPITTKGLVGFSSGTDAFLSFEDTVKTVTGVASNDATITDLLCYVNRRDTTWATPVNVDWSIMSSGASFSLVEATKYKELIDTLVSKLN